MLPQTPVEVFFRDPTLHSGVWLSHLMSYVPIPNKAKDTAEFAILDSWYYGLDLRRGYLTKEELVGVVKWKLMRGKMRPLLGKIQALTEAEIQAATGNAFNILRQSTNADHVRAALEKISKPLKGVGPATASAILARWDPSIPYMSDAGLIAVNGTTDYTIGAYMKYYQGIQAKVVQLNSDGQSNFQWTASTVEPVLHLIHSTR